jgi:hypothetical protein
VHPIRVTKCEPYASCRAGAPLRRPLPVTAPRVSYRPTGASPNIIYFTHRRPIFVVKVDVLLVQRNHGFVRPF